MRDANPPTTLRLPNHSSIQHEIGISSYVLLRLLYWAPFLVDCLPYRYSTHRFPATMPAPTALKKTEDVPVAQEVPLPAEGNKCPYAVAL